MPTGITIPAAQVRAILDAAVDRGAAVGELCRAVGVDPETLDEADARLPLDVAISMYETAARLVHDESFGLYVAERSDWYAFDPLGYALATKANVKRAVEELAPTIAMMYATRIEMIRVGDEARVTYALAEEPSGMSRHRSEAFMARILRLIRIGLGRDIAARWVSFRHEAPPDVTEHRRIFGDDVRFSEPANVLALEADVVELPFVASDPRLSGILDRHVRELAERAPAHETVAARVHRYLREAVPGGDTSIEAAARKLGLGSRALQRRLVAEGTSYRQVVEQARHELAVRYICDTRLPIKEIASRLGYSELRAFYRAFERWTGLPPAEYRRTR
jgi:AraC-like DNA-binding protein